MKKYLLLGMVLGMLVSAWFLVQPNGASADQTDTGKSNLTVYTGSGSRETITYAGQLNTIATATSSAAAGSVGRTFGITSRDTASTTIIFDLNSGESFDFNPYITASTSVNLTYQIYFSWDTGTTTKTWYLETSSTAASAKSVTHDVIEHTLAVATSTDYMGASSNSRGYNLLTTPLGSKAVMIRLGLRNALDQAPANAVIHPMVAPKSGV